ncbi:MAG: iron-sulfur cluster assembly accessory protein [Betaproteobacteria bacterium]|nr:iron-sulfur cluster assembly accessory protein [Betaproteobacteria bacterium]
MFSITEAAAEQIRHAARQPGNDELLLRVAAKLDDAGDLVYGMGFDEERDLDLRHETAGISVLIGQPSLELLRGTVLDFVELGPDDWRFIFIGDHNGPPPASGGCAPSGCASGGCGGCPGGA